MRPFLGMLGGVPTFLDLFLGINVLQSQGARVTPPLSRDVCRVAWCGAHLEFELFVFCAHCVSFDVCFLDTAVVSRACTFDRQNAQRPVAVKSVSHLAISRQSYVGLFEGNELLLQKARGKYYSIVRLLNFSGIMNRSPLCCLSRPRAEGGRTRSLSTTCQQGAMR